MVFILILIFRNTSMMVKLIAHALSGSLILVKFQKN